MKTIQSLLAVVQFMALCQIVFFGLIYRAITYDSDILPHMQDASLRLQVATWHMRTEGTAVHWGVGLGGAVFVVATFAALVLGYLRRRSREMENSAVANRTSSIGNHQ